MQKYIFQCSNCDYQEKNKFINCPKCNNGFGEKIKIDNKKINQMIQNSNEIEFNLSNKEIDNKEEERLKTSFNDLNKLFGGENDNIGLMKNSLTLIGGEPGIGKSTLLLQIINDITKCGLKCGYISAEENEIQIQKRYKRLQLKESFVIHYENNMNKIIQYFQDFDFLIIDSINTMYIEGEGVIGGSSQMKQCTMLLMEFAKKYQKTIIVIGQVTKDGDIAGPKIVEHMVDTVLFFENSDDNNVFRFLKSYKNRFGEVNEVSIFKMKSQGLEEVIDPSLLFINKNNNKTGSALSIYTNGNRNIFIEIQSLVVETQSEKPINKGIGYDSNRLLQISAILQKHLNLILFNHNVFVQIIGGLKINSPYIDLAVIASLISSMKNKNIMNYIFIGEVGLSGEIIPNTQEEQMIKDCYKFGFKNICSYTNNYKHIKDILKLF